jgi:hypothetical protein
MKTNQIQLEELKQLNQELRELEQLNKELNLRVKTLNLRLDTFNELVEQANHPDEDILLIEELEKFGEELIQVKRIMADNEKRLRDIAVRFKKV